MVKAIFNGTIIAESDQVETVKGKVYFPPGAINRSVFKETDYTTFCDWKGTASYYSVTVDGEIAENVSWTYRNPKPEAANIKEFVAFYPIVKIED